VVTTGIVVAPITEVLTVVAGNVVGNSRSRIVVVVVQVGQLVVALVVVVGIVVVVVVVVVAVVVVAIVVDALVVVTP
jgi:hypothetical protein